jgi:hypothetical protein
MELLVISNLKNMEVAAVKDAIAASIVTDMKLR